MLRKTVRMRREKEKGGWVTEKESGEKKGEFNAKSQTLGVAHSFFSSFFVCTTSLTKD